MWLRTNNGWSSLCKLAIKGGERFNVTPGSVEMSGMNRSFDEQTLKKLPLLLRNMIENVYIVNRFLEL